MVRLALLIVPLLAFVGCQTPNPNYNPIDAAMGCKIKSQCTDTNSPVCDTTTNGGICVACTVNDPGACQGKTPICMNNRCTACTQHGDCKDSNACLTDGSCAAVAQVAYVDPTGTDNPDCTKATPCTKLMTALAKKRSYVKLHGTTDEAVTISDQNVTLLADPATSLTRSMDGVILQITGTSNVEIDDLQINGGTSSNNNPGIVIPGGNNVMLMLKRAKISGTKDNGISISGGRITIEATEISNNQKAGINCQDGSLTISRSTISGNQGGGIATGGIPTFDITNTFIDRNGSISSGVGGALLTLSPGHTNRFEFNTVVDNQVKNSALLTGGVQCDDPTFKAPNNLIIRNSVNNDPTQPNANTIGACMYLTSTIDQTVTALNFRSPNTSSYDYHIQAGSSAIRKATTPSSVPVDFDGDQRPQNVSDQGADQYKP